METVLLCFSPPASLSHSGGAHLNGVEFSVICVYVSYGLSGLLLPLGSGVVSVSPMTHSFSLYMLLLSI